jgi:prophage antirepressor-like protein
MNTSPINFEFDTTTIRVIEIEGEPWFVASDALNAMGYSRGGHKMIRNKLDDIDKGIKRIDTLGGPQDISIISESGLYKIIMRSDKPEARAFQDWVTRVVLPAIRKDGGYIMGEEKLATGEMSEDDFIATALQMANNKLKRVEAENKAMVKELTRVTIQEWTAFNHVYLSQSQKGRLTRLAKTLCKNEATPVERMEREYTDNYGRTFDTYSNVYPRQLVDQAAMSLGLVSSVQPVAPTH